MTRHYRTWTHETDAQLTRLWRQGLSMGQIAARMGLTRNQVAGRRASLKLPKRISNDGGANVILARVASRRGKASGHTTKLNKLRRETREGTGPDFYETADDFPDVTRRCGLMDLDNHTCRWPVSGRGSAMMFCGAEPIEGGAYCRHHTERGTRQRGADE